MDWELLAEWVQSGSSWAISIAVSLSCISLYHKIIQVPRNLIFKSSLDRLSSGIETILVKLNDIEKKVNIVDKNYAFLKGRFKIGN